MFLGFDCDIFKFKLVDVFWCMVVVIEKLIEWKEILNFI